MSPLPSGDDIRALLGLRATNPLVQQALEQLAHGMRPELDPEDEEALTDWVTVNEIGLEFGFQDEAWVLALDPDLRRHGDLLLTQLYFYGETPRTRAFPGALPFRLTFTDDRVAAREKLRQHEATRRSDIRDTWALPEFLATVTYRPTSGTIESVLCHIPERPWPSVPGEAELVAPFTPTMLVSLFGRKWSDTGVRKRLAPLGYEDALAGVRAQHSADFRLTHGVELAFMPGREIRDSNPLYPTSLVVSGVTYYARRELDACEWAGVLPHDLSFKDSRPEVFAKMTEPPAREENEELWGRAVWHFARYTLVVIYSLVENRVLRVMMLAPRQKGAGE